MLYIFVSIVCWSSITTIVLGKIKRFYLLFSLKITQLTRFLRDHRSQRSRQISSLTGEHERHQNTRRSFSFLVFCKALKIACTNWTIIRWANRLNPQSNIFPISLSYPQSTLGCQDCSQENFAGQIHCWINLHLLWASCGCWVLGIRQNRRNWPNKQNKVNKGNDGKKKNDYKK